METMAVVVAVPSSRAQRERWHRHNQQRRQRQQGTSTSTSRLLIPLSLALLLASLGGGGVDANGDAATDRAQKRFVDMREYIDCGVCESAAKKINQAVRMALEDRRSYEKNVSEEKFQKIFEVRPPSSTRAALRAHRFASTSATSMVYTQALLGLWQWPRRGADRRRC